MRCPKCGSEESGAFCSRCGADLRQEGPACASCGAGIELDALFCAECGAPTGRRPAKPHLAYLPWALSGLALVAFAVAIAFFVQAQTQPRIGDMPVTGGLPEAPREEAGGAGTQGAGTGMVDLSQLSSRQAADRLFERAMRTDEEGDAHRVQEAEGSDRNGGDVVEPRPEQVLDDLREGRLRQADRLDRLRQFALDQRDVGGLDGDVGPGADGDADIGLLERRRVVDAVADHRDLLAVLALQLADLVDLAFGQHAGQHLVDADLRRHVPAVRSLSPVIMTTWMPRSCRRRWRPWNPP
jgi:hypothetical protein